MFSIYTLWQICFISCFIIKYYIFNILLYFTYFFNEYFKYNWILSIHIINKINKLINKNFFHIENKNIDINDLENII